MGNIASDGTTTPAGDADDDFFSSWDKPTIKRPTPPVSRTATPPTVGRTPSPFLNSGTSIGIARTSSPLVNSESATPRITSSAALRKTTATTGPRKANVLGAKKTTKLGAKKIIGDVIDFDAAEKTAKEEAERIEKLGYDPDAEDVVSKAGRSSNIQKASETTSVVAGKIAAPTPISPGRSGGFGSTTRERSDADMARLGMGMGRLGFGQVGGNKATASTTKKSGGGFGSVGPIKAAQEGRNIPFCMVTELTYYSDDEQKYAREKFGNQKGIGSDEFFGKGDFDPHAKNEAKNRLQGFEGASAISSNAYFGREEEEGGSEDYGDLETAAKDFIRKFGVTAGDDLENLTEALGQGATKLQGAIRSYLQG